MYIITVNACKHYILQLVLSELCHRTPGKGCDQARIPQHLCCRQEAPQKAGKNSWWWELLGLHGVINLNLLYHIVSIEVDFHRNLQPWHITSSWHQKTAPVISSKLPETCLDTAAKMMAPKSPKRRVKRRPAAISSGPVYSWHVFYCLICFLFLFPYDMNLLSVYNPNIKQSPLQGWTAFSPRSDAITSLARSIHNSHLLRFTYISPR